jgi:hypothetical protein
MRRLVSLLFVVLIVVVAGVVAGACGSASTRPPELSRPEIDVRLAGNPYFGSTSTAPATIEVEVVNTANVPVIVRRIEIDSPGMAQYQVVRTNKIVRETIAPGEGRVIAMTVTLVRAARNLSEPLTLRAFIDFESAGDVSWREVVMTRGRAF